MADGVEFSLVGVDQLINTLREVKYETKRKGGRTALRKAAQVVRDDAKQRAGQLDDAATGRQISGNIAERWNGQLYKRTGDLGFRVGVLHGAVIRKKGNPDTGTNGPTPHWRLLEFGTKYASAQPFMRPALENNIDRATSVFITEYEKALVRAIRRANKKGVSA